AALAHTLTRSALLERYGLAAILLAGLVLRLAVLGQAGYPSDPTEVTRWAEATRSFGLGSFYANVQGGYYPALLYVLWPLAALLHGDALYVAVKGLAIPFDLITGLALYRATAPRGGRSAGLVAAALFVLNPAAIVGGALWGQVDVVGALGML